MVILLLVLVLLVVVGVLRVTKQQLNSTDFSNSSRRGRLFAVWVFAKRGRLKHLRYQVFKIFDYHHSLRGISGGLNWLNFDSKVSGITHL